MADAALRELKWMKQLLEDMRVTHEEPMELFCDSQSVLHIVANHVFYERTKNIESDCHSVRDAVQNRLIVTRHARTTEQLVDIMTKALESPSFRYLCLSWAFAICMLQLEGKC